MDIDFSKLKFEFSWSSVVIIVGLLTTCITFIVKNNELQGSIKSLKDDVKTLSVTVQTMKGSQDITNNAINQFMQFPPGELKYRIEVLEHTVQQHSPLQTEQPAAPFKNVNPR